MSIMEQTLLLHLEEDEAGTYWLSNPDAVSCALARAMLNPDAEEEVVRTLSFAAALRGELQSEVAADQLVAMLRAEPLAFAIVANDVLDAAPIDETRAFREKEGREALNRAPCYGAAESEGLHIRDFLDVAGGIKIARVVRDSRKEQSDGRRSRKNEQSRGAPEGQCESDPQS